MTSLLAISRSCRVGDACVASRLVSLTSQRIDTQRDTQEASRTVAHFFRAKSEAHADGYDDDLSGNYSLECDAGRLAEGLWPAWGDTADDVEVFACS